ncbi:MAG: gamma-glutamyltransferase, partial [Limnohabitans sp.]
MASKVPGALTTPLQPEVASGLVRNADVITLRTAVASANPLASQAGLDILQAGGSAVDAAIAVQMVLGLVEPQSSGIGGGAFLLHTNGAGPTRRIQAFDGRETAPAGADESL